MVLAAYQSSRTDCARPAWALLASVKGVGLTVNPTLVPYGLVPPENPYYQYFTGETVFQWKFPVAPSDMVYFRKRIGTEGLERILAASIKVHGESALEEEVILDTTVQEKNITHPTDVKLYSRVIESCWRTADKEDIELRQRYSRVRKKYL